MKPSCVDQSRGSIDDVKQRRHTTKLLGSIKRSVHVPGQPEVAYELPAQSPAGEINRK